MVKNPNCEVVGRGGTGQLVVGMRWRRAVCSFAAPPVEACTQQESFCSLGFPLHTQKECVHADFHPLAGSQQRMSWNESRRKIEKKQPHASYSFLSSGLRDPVHSQHPEDHGHSSLARPSPAGHAPQPLHPDGFLETSSHGTENCLFRSFPGSWGWGGWVFRVHGVGWGGLALALPASRPNLAFWGL